MPLNAILNMIFYNKLGLAFGRVQYPYFSSSPFSSPSSISSSNWSQTLPKACRESSEFVVVAPSRCCKVEDTLFDLLLVYVLNVCGEGSVEFPCSSNEETMACAMSPSSGCLPPFSNPLVAAVDNSWYRRLQIVVHVKEKLLQLYSVGASLLELEHERAPDNDVKELAEVQSSNIIDHLDVDAVNECGCELR